MLDLFGGSKKLPRALTTKERELLLWLIEHPSEKAAPDVRGQIDHLSVYSLCSCGCPTINLAFDGIPVPGKGSRLVSDYLAIVDGQDVGVMLFETDGQVGCLEVYSCAGLDEPFGLPDISTIYPLEAPAKG